MPPLHQFASLMNQPVARFFLIVTILISATGCLNDDNKIPDNCYDGILNNGEELVDCGGAICPACDPCENGQYDVLLGEQWVDCGGECEPCDPNFNGMLDPGETGVDCGGTTGVACGELCGDGLLNGLEEGVDCGGPDCEVCPTCDDGLMNGDEIGIDCGGMVMQCDPCATNGDCTNGLMDGDELYIDCGGSTCPDCLGILTWKANGATIVADYEASAMMSGTTVQMGGVSVTTQGLAMTLAEPELVGWLSGTTLQCGPTTAPGSVCVYTAVGGNTYSSANGGMVNVEVTYVDATSGGIIVGTFNGTVVDDLGASVNLAQGSFVLPIN